MKPISTSVKLDRLSDALGSLDASIASVEKAGAERHAEVLGKLNATRADLAQLCKQAHDEYLSPLQEESK